MSATGIAPEPLFSVRGSRLQRRRGTWAFLLVAVGFSAIVLGFFHDRFWYAPDDGAYAYVASRMLAGDALHRDIQDIHAGYINYVNALALRVFGHDLVSLRYPLVGLGILQAGLLFLLILPAGRLTALAGSAALTGLSFVQFLNPTAHWYGLFLVVAIIATLTWLPREAFWRPMVLGLLLMTLLLFRQLTGVIVGIGVLSFLLLELPGGRGAGRLGRGTALVMAVGLAGYAVTKTSGAAAVLYAGPPVAILIWQAVRLRVGNAAVTGLLARLAAGAAAGLLPLLLYHAGQGSLAAWYQDAVSAALALTRLDFIGQGDYLVLAAVGLLRLLSFDSIGTMANGLFWALLPLLPVILGVAVMWRVATGGVPHPLPYIAAFYTVVSLHFQIPIYLFYTAGLTLAGLLFLGAAAAPRLRPGLAAGSVLLVAIALFYQAGQPLTRGVAGILAGERVPMVKAEGLARAPLWMTAADAAAYDSLLDIIMRETAADDTILALPVNPELYFLSGRRGALPFFNSAIGLQDAAAVAAAVETLQAAPPLLVFHRPDDKYNNFASAGLMAFVADRYGLLRRVGDIDVYRLR